MKADRRGLMLGAALAALGGGALAWKAPWREVPIDGGDGGADMARGHRLRDGGFPEPTEEEHIGIAIAGGGVAGLSAAWTLAQSGFNDFRLLELEDQVGGNARGGRNEVSAYPLGAHYLPIPNVEATALRNMLIRLGIIVGEVDGRPIYDPLQLCADLEERLFWRGRWQEGLIPTTGVAVQDRADITAFHKAMTTYRNMMGSDGKPAFAVPMAYSSEDAALSALDGQSFAQWLDARGWHSAILRAHIRYACRDDYGTEPDQVSAWAGIHYFAARRGFAANGAGDNQLTWPEGNARLVALMRAGLTDRIAPKHIVFRVAPTGTGGVTIDSFDDARGISIRTHADGAIVATPHFVAARLLPKGMATAEGFSYAPWLVANVTVDRLPVGRGVPVAWDNVSSTGDSLGYVVATHQSKSASDGPSVLTWYMPLSDMSPASARKLLIDRSAETWRRIVTDDLLAMNPDLDGAIRRIDLWKWGHAMIRPEPGFLQRSRAAATAAMVPPVFLAHSDLSGLSLFEEAHYRGVSAAEAAMSHLDHPYESQL